MPGFQFFGDVLEAKDLPAEIGAVPEGDASLSLSAVEKQHIRQVLRQTKGNKAEAARLLQIGIATLYRKIEEYGLG